MARDLYDDHFKAVESMPRGVVVTLRNIATQLESAWELHTNRQVTMTPASAQTPASFDQSDLLIVILLSVLECVRGNSLFCSHVFQCIEGENTWRDLMKTALENLIVVLKDENTISPYEMCSSGLVQALFTVLNNVRHTRVYPSSPFTSTLSSSSLFPVCSVSNCLSSALQSVELELKHDCKPLMERINVFKTAFSENEDDER